MRLEVQPDALRAAAADLDRCATVLEDAVAEFGGAARRCAPGAGRAAYDAVAAAGALGEHAVQVLATDLRLLRDALDRLASAYPDVDNGMLRPVREQ